MTTFFGKYASQPAVVCPTAGVVIHLDATDGYTTGTTVDKVINIGGTYHIFKLPPYARLLDVQTITDAIGGAATSILAGNLALIMYGATGGDGAGSVHSLASLLVINSAFYNASLFGMVSMRERSMFLSATNVDLGTYTATWSASSIRTVYTGASAAYNVAATEKYVSLLIATSATLCSGAQGLTATPAYTYWGIDYRMCDGTVDDVTP